MGKEPVYTRAPGFYIRPGSSSRKAGRTGRGAAARPRGSEHAEPGGGAMDNAKLVALILAVAVVVAAGAVSAQAPAAPPAYGPPITLEQAKKAMASAEAEARKNSWNVVIAIVDSGGNIVMLQRLDDTQFGSIDVARQKAHTAVAF